MGGQWGLQLYSYCHRNKTFCTLFDLHPDVTLPGSDISRKESKNCTENSVDLKMNLRNHKNLDPHSHHIFFAVAGGMFSFPLCQDKFDYYTNHSFVVTTLCIRICN
jgi:hypothetical protein